MPSPTLGTRLIKKYGEEAHRAEVRHNKEYDEYQVHHYEDGKHMGEGPVSYHGDDKEDAHDTAQLTYEQRAKQREKSENPSKYIVTSENREEFIAQKMAQKAGKKPAKVDDQFERVKNHPKYEKLKQALGKKGAMNALLKELNDKQ